MKIRFWLAFVFIGVLFAPAFAQTIEGPIWWWDVKSSDFIVEGVITYDEEKYLEIDAARVEGKGKKYYWLVGSLKINKVLYINKNSEHLEEYRLYQKEAEKTFEVLIPAYQSTFFFDGAKNKLRLRPVFGIDITKEATILNLTQISIYPIINVTVRSLVPVENINQARELIAKRDNNLLAK